jgi:hypothetical protein
MGMTSPQRAAEDYRRYKARCCRGSKQQEGRLRLLQIFRGQAVARHSTFSMMPGRPIDKLIVTHIAVLRLLNAMRFNRPGDFRASGSGTFDTDPEKIDEKFLRLAFLTAKKLRTQSCAIDGLYRGQDPLIAELQYTFVSSKVRACPGHRELDGEPQNGTLNWLAGQMWPEEAQAKDFIAKIRRTYDADRGDVPIPA